MPNNEIVNKAAKLKKRLQKISSKYIYLVFRVSRQAGQVKKKNTFRTKLINNVLSRSLLFLLKIRIYV